MNSSRLHADCRGRREECGNIFKFVGTPGHHASGQAILGCVLFSPHRISPYLLKNCIIVNAFSHHNKNVLFFFGGSQDFDLITSNKTSFHRLLEIVYTSYVMKDLSSHLDVSLALVRPAVVCSWLI